MKSGMRLLMTADAVGGVWQYALDLARGLAAWQVETVLAMIGPALTAGQRELAGSVPNLQLIETGLELDWLAADANRVARAGARIARLAKVCDANIVQLNAPALAAETRFPVPVVAVSHSCIATWWRAMGRGALPPDFEWRVALTRAGLQAADRVVTPSAAFADATMQAHRLRRPPAVVHNGRYPLALTPRPQRDFAFTAGRLWDQSKNLRLLDRVAARLPVPLSAAGPTRGPNGETVFLNRIDQLGTLDEAGIARCLAEQPIFVSAARYEPFGLAVLEAAAAECALILSDIPTFRELWDGCAIFVDPDDEEGLAKTITTIAGDKQKRAALGHAARGRAALYTPARMAAGMAAIYRDLLAAGRRPIRTRVTTAPQVAA